MEAAEARRARSYVRKINEYSVCVSIYVAVILDTSGSQDVYCISMSEEKMNTCCLMGMKK